jgi:putative ABC transport system permease protein
MFLSGIGALLGITGAIALARAMAALLFGTPELGSYLLATIVLFGACLIASAVPALRAAQVQPMAALRNS